MNKDVIIYFIMVKLEERLFATFVAAGRTQKVTFAAELRELARVDLRLVSRIALLYKISS